MRLCEWVLRLCEWVFVSGSVGLVKCDDTSRISLCFKGNWQPGWVMW
jgi:hypothetical protein